MDRPSVGPDSDANREGSSSLPPGLGRARYPGAAPAGKSSEGLRRVKNYMMIKQRVADFAQFQAAFDELLPRRREYGLIDIGTFREASEPDTIVVLMEVTDVARAKEYWHSQVLEAGRRRAGVVGPLRAGRDQVWLTNGPVIQ